MKITSLTPEGRDFLEARGLAPEKVAHLGVYSEHGEHGRQAVAFRHYVDESGAKDHWAFRALDTKAFWQSKKTKRTLWNNQILQKGYHEVIITEGHIDAMSFAVAGFHNVMSVPDGAPDTEIESPVTKFDYLKGHDWNALKSVILATDNDAPGQILRDELAKRIGRARCKFVTYPKGCKDANDVLNAHGPEGLAGLLSTARYLPISGILTLAEIPERPPEAPWDTGIAGLDDLWRPAPGRMTVLTGIPGAGKTEIITDIVGSLIQRHNIAVAIASFEDDVRDSLVPRFTKWYCGRPLADCDLAAQMKAEDWINNHIIFIQPPDDDDSDEPADVAWFNERAAAAALQNNCRVIICDPWNELDHTARPADVNVVEYAGEMLKRMRRGARKGNYHLVLAAHPKKMHKGGDGRPAMPTGYDVADAAHFFNKPDNGLTVHRGEGNRVEIVSWKCRREGVIGTLGRRCFIYRKDDGRYEYDEIETFRPVS